MVGAIVGAAALNVFFGLSYMPSYAKYTAQITAGAFIGCSMEKKDIKRFKYLLKPLLALLAGILVLNIVLGFVIYYISPLDLLTSLMSSVPGGMTDIPLISADMGADSPKVAVLQFVRMASGIGLFPALITMVARREAKETDRHESDNLFESPEGEKSGKPAARVFIQTISVAAVFGILGIILHIPSGALLFAMIGTVCFKMLFNKSHMPDWAKRLAQVLSGAYVGSSMSYSDVLELKQLVLPALVLLAGYFAASYIIGKVLSRHFGMSLKEAMLAATPAGATDMALISADLGIQSPDLIVIQIARMLIVIALFPPIISLIVMLAG